MPKLLDRVRAAVSGDDAERLAKRRDIKKQLANLEAVASRHRALGEQLKFLDDRESKAVSGHQGRCQPLQAELSDIDAKISDAILAGEAVDDRLAMKRGKCLGTVADENTKLAAEVDVLKKLRTEFQKQRRALDQQLSTITTVRAQLTAPGVANSNLLLDRHTVTSEATWADKRLNAARVELQRAEGALRLQERQRESNRYTNSRGEVTNDPQPDEHERHLGREVDQAQAEIAAAEQARADALERRDRIRQDIVSE